MPGFLPSLPYGIFPLDLLSLFFSLTTLFHTSPARLQTGVRLTVDTSHLPFFFFTFPRNQKTFTPGRLGYFETLFLPLPPYHFYPFYPYPYPSLSFLRRSLVLSRTVPYHTREKEKKKKKKK
jgi:hypothetical protein